MNRRIVITGVNGFVGRHLVNELKNRGAQVIGVARSNTDEELAQKLETFIACDLTDAEEVSSLDFGQTDAIIHLAALSNPSESFKQPQLYVSANSAMVINLYERILAQKLEKSPRVILVSTGAVYNSYQPMPIAENGELANSSPYSISKLLSENLAEHYHTRGIDSITARPFNHTGPGQPAGFILPDMVKQLLEVGVNGTLRVGNLQSRRDYTDVRDVVRAYAELATADHLNHRLYNVCSGSSRSGEELVGLISQALFGADANLNIEVDPAKIRPNDPPEITGDNQLIRGELGWQPTIPLEQTVKDYVEWAMSEQRQTD